MARTMTTKNHLLIAFLKNNCLWHVEKLYEKTCQGISYSVNF